MRKAATRSSSSPELATRAAPTPPDMSDTAPLGVDREALSNYLDTMCREPLVEMATTCVATHSRFHGFPVGCDRAAPYPPPRATAIR